jgi:hypothetical protein
MKNKLGEAVLCAISKHYKQWVQAEKAFPGIGKGVSLKSKLILGPSSLTFSDYIDKTK